MKNTTDEIGYKAQESGKPVGKLTPSKDTKWYGWEVYNLEGKFISCCVDKDGDMCFAVEIEESEIPKYIEK